MNMPTGGWSMPSVDQSRLGAGQWIDNDLFNLGGGTGSPVSPLEMQQRRLNFDQDVFRDNKAFNQQRLDQQGTQNVWSNSLGALNLGIGAFGAITGYRQGKKQIELGKEQLAFNKKNATTNIWNQAATLRDQMVRRAQFGAYDTPEQRAAAVAKAEGKASNIRDMGDPDKQ